MAAPMRSFTGKIKFSLMVKSITKISLPRVCSYVSYTRKEKDKKMKFDEASRTVLDFFNNCDYLTLRKLLENKSKDYRDLDPIQLVSYGKIPKRFENLDIFQQKFNIDNDSIRDLAADIEKLRTDDKYGLGIRLNLSTNQKQKIKTVIAVDILRDKLVWTEETLDRQLLNVGCVEAFNYGGHYHHTIYQKQALEAVKQIPDSNLYVHFTNMEMFDGGLTCHQVCSETLVMALLNCRGNSNEEFSFKIVRNKVFQLPYKVFWGFYNLKNIEETLSAEWMLDSLLEDKISPLSGIQMTDEVKEVIENCPDDHNLITKCLIMSDLVCRCLTKQSDKFPRAYSVHRGV